MVAASVALVRSLPIVDVSPLVTGTGDIAAVAAAIGAACRDVGFFHVTGHGVPADLQLRLDEDSRAFFALPDAEKARVRMELGGSAWRGWFPVGDELTSGVPDLKEGVYFGAEGEPGDPRPLHGPNLFPERPARLRETVLAYLAAMTDLGQALLRGVALSLDLDENWFHDRYTAEPTILFRIFHYPAVPTTGPGAASGEWGVGEHTDYGLLTILRTDDVPGLQVRAGSEWIAADPAPGDFVVNIGDMLDRLTGGRYRSTPHRVVRSTGRDRLSWPFFLDPGLDADVRPVGRADLAAPDDRASRWDHASVHEFSGTYGDYLLGKIGKVFPGLRDDVL